MTNTKHLERALRERFSGEKGKDELTTISEHGCSGGVGGFIYSQEINEFFNEHESEIEDVLSEMMISLHYLVKDPEDDGWTFAELKQNAVWTIVEEYATRTSDQ